MVNEPQAGAFPNVLLRWLAATRPAFLGVTLIACLIGLASAATSGVEVDALRAVTTLVLALAAHAAANVINDVHDAINGSDAANAARIFPFTGGSRFIQNGVLGLREAALLGYGLLALVVPGGLWLVTVSGCGLLFIGGAGLFIAWAYSAPPLALMCRGLGEPAIVVAWLLVVCGADLVQRASPAWLPAVAGLSYALLVAGILYVNQFPDVAADAAAGKRTCVVRLGPKRARWGGWVIALLSVGCLAGGVASGVLPMAAMLALLSLPVSLCAASGLVRHAEQPARLVPAIRLTLIAAHLHGLLLVMSLLIAPGVPE